MVVGGRVFGSHLSNKQCSLLASASERCGGVQTCIHVWPLLRGMLWGGGRDDTTGPLGWRSRVLVRAQRRGSEADEGGVDLAHAGQR